jgi:hypothetical protein
MEQLQKQFGVDSIAAAEEKLKELEQEVEEWDEKILSATEELENILNGNQDTTTEESAPTRKRPVPANSEGSDGPKRRTPRQPT